MSSTSLYFLSRDLTEQFFQPYFDRLDNTYTGFTRSTAVIRSGSSVVGQMAIARRLEAVRAISHIFFKSMNWLTEGLADDDHGLIFIVETSSSMSRWFQPFKQSPSTQKMSMKDTAHTVCIWISSALRNMTPRKGSIRSVQSFSN